MAAHGHVKVIADGQLVDVWDMWLRPNAHAAKLSVAVDAFEAAAELRMRRFAEERGCVPGVMPSSLKGAGWGMSSTGPDMEEMLRELLVKFEQVLPKLVWKDVPPDSHQRGLIELIARYRCRFFQGTGEGWFVTLSVFMHEDGTVGYDVAVAHEGAIVRLPREVAERVASFAEKDGGSTHE